MTITKILINGRKYRKNKYGVIQKETLGVKNGSLVLIWHKVCMSNGDKLIDSCKIRKAFEAK